MKHDALHHMIDLQLNLQKEVYGINPSELSDDDKMKFIRNMILACTDELHEALNETGWKSWSNSVHLNEEAFKNELVDAWHFLMNLMLVVDMNANEFYNRYLAKREKNIKRQEEGYDGLNKCPTCKRAYDDDAVECFSQFDGKPAFCAKTMQILHD